MFAKIIAICVFANILASGVLSLPPLQLGAQISDIRDHKINLGHRRTVGSSIKARLPTNVIPSFYQVDIIPILDPVATDFLQAPGHVTITAECVEATNQIVLNIVQITIEPNSVKVKTAAGVNVPVTNQTADADAQTFTITLGAPLVADTEYIIDIPFVARVANDRRDGLYLSTYTTGGVTNYHAATQFEDISARKAFPCFDEPALKAIFQFRLGRNETGFQTLWNMDKEATIRIDGREGYVWDVYPPVPQKMPTYLLAIVVSDFESDLADDSIFDKPVRTWGPKNLMASSDHGAFASENAAKILKFFEEYLDYPYDFPKMDSVAVPVFSAGAMENWGLNLYQTYYLLFTEGESTQLEKWNMASVLAHELSHQWWGNLVTMRWWNDLWLNEGFANYMQFYGANYSAPQFEPMQRVTIDTMQRALDFDAGLESVPIHLLDLENPTTPPSRIVYDKGSSIIRMMNAYLTKDTLINGLRNYLKAKAYDNAVQDELFEHLTTQAHADETLPADVTVKQIMDTWTLQAGFPLIRVTRASTTRLYFTQERFVNTPLVQHAQQESWYVPIAYVTKAAPDVDVESLAPKFWINNDVLLKSHDMETTNEWVLLNPDSQSYYRVLYDDHLTELLQGQLAVDHKQIPILSRGQLLDDYFKSAYAGYSSIREAMEFTLYLDKEDELPVWTTAFNNLRKPLTVLTDSSFGDNFYSYLMEKVAPPLARIGGQPTVGESPVTTLLRTQLLDWACALGHEHCFNTSSILFTQWMATPTQNPIWADFQPMLYCAAVARQGTDTLWTFVLNKYKDTTASVRQQGLLLNAMACTVEPVRIESLIQMAANLTSDIRAEHAVTLLEKIAASQDGRYAVYDYIKANPQAILDNPRLGKAAISRVAIALSNYFNTEEDKADMEKYLNDNLDRFDDELETSLKTAIATIGSNIEWIAMHGPGLTEFFAMH